MLKPEQIEYIRNLLGVRVAQCQADQITASTAAQTFKAQKEQDNIKEIYLALG